jgi:hypothetical protein
VPPARQRRGVRRHYSEHFQTLFRTPPAHHLRPATTLTPRRSDSYGRFRSGIAVPDCRSIAIDRVHRPAGFLLVSLSKMPRGHRTTAPPRACHPGTFPIKANDHPGAIPPIRLKCGSYRKFSRPPRRPESRFPPTGARVQMANAMTGGSLAHHRVDVTVQQLPFPATSAS